MPRIDRAVACAWLSLGLLAGTGCASVDRMHSVPSAQGSAIASAQDNEARLALLQEAKRLIERGQPAAALDGPLQRILATFEARPATRQRVYCARSSAESRLYVTDPAHGGDVLVLSWTWAQAYQLRGYALVELGRRDEAMLALQKAESLSPWNAAYLIELGHLHKVQGHFASALDLFTRAESAARIAAPDEVRILELTQALRGQGQSLIEMWRLEEAAARYRASLAIDPKDDKASGELHYVQVLQQRIGSAFRR